MKRKLKALLPWLVAAMLFSPFYFMAVTPMQAQTGITNFTSLQTSGFVYVGTFIRLRPADTITYTTGALTARASLQPVRVTSNRGLTNVTVLPANTVVTFRNVGTPTIGFTDTTPLVLGGTRVLGQYDQLTLISDGTRWIEQAFANN